MFPLSGDGLGQVVVEDPVSESGLLLQDTLESVHQSSDVAVSLELFFHELTSQVVSQLMFTNEKDETDGKTNKVNAAAAAAFG